MNFCVFTFLLSKEDINMNKMNGNIVIIDFVLIK